MVGEDEVGEESIGGFLISLRLLQKVKAKTLAFGVFEQKATTLSVFRVNGLDL